MIAEILDRIRKLHNIVNSDTPGLDTAVDTLGRGNTGSAGSSDSRSRPTLLDSVS